MDVKNVEDIYELTPIQQGFLFHFLYHPGSGVYIEHMSFTFKGDFDRPAFKKAWEHVVERHPILRTSFHTDIEKPVQAVHRKVELPLEEWDWRHWSPEEQEHRYQVFLQRDREQDFDFTKPPLMRLTLIQLNDDTVRFAWRFPHLVMDGWSFGLALSEFFHSYKAYRRGERPRLSPPRRYRDYVSWWKRQDSREAERYWRDAFAGWEPPEPLDLGKGEPPSEDGATHHWEQISNEAIAESLKQVTRQGKLTMNTLVQAAWALVLSRYLGTDDVVAGTTIAHQPSDLLDPTTEAMMGPMIATLPVRARLKADEPLLSWLQEFQVQQAAIREHANASLVQIQQWCGVPRSERFFESTVTFENVPIPQYTLEEEGLELLDVAYDGRPHYSLTLIILPGDELPLRLVYDRRRYNRAAIRRLLCNLQATLQAMAHHPHQTLGELDGLAQDERQQLLEGWQPVEEKPVDHGLHRLFQEQVARTPEATALSCNGETLSYRELDRRSNQLAQALRKRGVTRGTPVGLCVERSLHTMVSILGILKAGGCYVPLDPVAPQERLAFIMKDSGSCLVVTETDLREKVEGAGIPVLHLDGEEGDWLQESDHPVDDESTPSDLAYIMYTSGTTGQPKGTLVTHANIVRLIRGMTDLYHFHEQDIWTLFHTYAFDVSVGEMWGALLNGGKLVIVPYEVSRRPDQFLDLLQRERVTVLTQTPSAFEQLIAYEGETAERKPLALRYVLFIGERLEMAGLRPWVERHGDEQPQLINTYGPTETSVYVTHRRITAADLDDTRSFIGRPLPDLRMYLLDEKLRPVPLGAKGEICVSGPAVAQGYLNRPEQTAERFVADPYHPSTRLYRTGDWGRFTEDGDLEFCGRIDDQVKIRGYRVEPGEIETWLRAHADVQVAAVTVREDVPGNPRLVAYIVPTTESFSEPELRAFLQEKVPEYMIPTVWVTIDAIPLNANGKLDRKALPQPERTWEEEGYVEPRTSTEKELAQLFSEVLGLPQVGVQDHLLDRGLHSLLVMRVKKRIRESLGTEVSLRALFESPTVEALARLIDGTAEEVPALDLKQEVHLDDSIQGSNDQKWNPKPQFIFLTGATGFLGGFLLNRLLASTSATLYCLVRGEDRYEAGARLRDHLQSLGIWSDAYADRIIPVLGDLSRPHLGIDSDTFQTLARTVDVIYHCAAQVNFLHPYEYLKTSNVSGTQEVLRLAAEGKIKPLHYVSTVGTVGLGQDAPVLETRLGEEPPEMNSGYAKSKWVAERMVSLAQQRGLPVTIYRPGRVTGHSSTGAWKTDDAVCQVIRALTYMDTIPDVDLRFDMVPVDYVSEAIVTLSQDEDSLGQVFHLTNPRRSSIVDLAAGLTQAGYSLTWVDFDTWDASLQELAHAMPGEGFDTTRALFTPWVRGHLNGKHEPPFDCSQTLAALQGRLSCPPVDADMVENYLSYLAQIGFIRSQQQANR